MLNDDQKEKLVEACYHIMEDIGMDIHLPAAVDMLSAAGCEVDGLRVRIPREVTKKAIATAPTGIRIYDRDGKEAMLLEGRNSYFGPGPTCPNFFDPYTGQRRPATKADAAAAALVSDALPNIDYVMSLTMISDKTNVLADLEEVDAMVRNTTKPICTWAFNAENMEAIFKMCAAVVGGEDMLRQKPFLIVYSEPTTPLSHSKDALEKLIIAAKYGVPCIYTPGMILGGTSPTTIAGSLPMGLAECLTGLVISQLVAPGAPFIGGTSGSPLDMRSMQTPYGSPEASLLLGASNEVMRYLGLPSFDMAGATESKRVDAQSGVETAMEVLISLESGGNLIHDCGFMDIGMTGSLDQLVFCDEVISMAKRYCRSVEVDEDRIGFDTIASVGPGGNFLGEEHTFKFFRSDVWNPTLIERRPYDAWETDGSKDMATRVHEKMLTILENHKPGALAPEVLSTLDDILNRAEAACK
ncbi:MAG: trimethylamine methyltransferase family protein [Bacillota bacterium]|nr:trimethylamine methyltransferase family protein [Bacillota bacterium]